MNEPPVFSVLDPVEAQRREGENVFTAFVRLAVHESMYRCGGVQKRAAELCGVSPTMFTYHVHNKATRTPYAVPREKSCRRS